MRRLVLEINEEKRADFKLGYSEAHTSYSDGFKYITKGQDHVWILDGELVLDNEILDDEVCESYIVDAKDVVTSTLGDLPDYNGEYITNQTYSSWTFPDVLFTAYTEADTSVAGYHVLSYAGNVSLTGLATVTPATRVENPFTDRFMFVTTTGGDNE